MVEMTNNEKNLIAFSYVQLLQYILKGVDFNNF
jgi:hypothetical protein